MKSLSKEGIEVLKTNPKWFEDGFHGKTGEVLSKKEFVYRIKALRSIGKAITLSNLRKHQGRTCF
jgi:ribosomal protein L21E